MNIEGKKKNKISRLEVLRIKKLQDEEYNRRLSESNLVTNKFHEQDLYESLRTDPKKFLDKPVCKPDRSGELQPSTVKSGPDKVGTYNESVIRRNQEILLERTQTFDKDTEAKNNSRRMEVIFSDLVHLIFPGFEVNIPAEIDDNLNATDLTLYRRTKDNKILDIFSFDMFYQAEPNIDIYWKRKIYKNTQRLLNGNFSYINYIHAPNIQGVVDELFFSAENCPVFLLPVSEMTLRKIFKEYALGGFNSETINSITDELRYCIFLQIELIKKVLSQLASESSLEGHKSQNLIKIVNSIQKSLGHTNLPPENFKDNTIRDVCFFIERIVKTDSDTKKFLKSVKGFKDTLELKAEIKRVASGKEKHFKNMTKREKNTKKKNEVTNKWWQNFLTWIGKK